MSKKYIRLRYWIFNRYISSSGGDIRVLSSLKRIMDIKKILIACFLLSLFSLLSAKHKADLQREWDLQSLKKMNFNGGLLQTLNSKDRPFYNHIYTFGDHLSDTGNLLGTRFVPNQWPWPLGEGVNLYSEPLSIIFSHKIPFPIIDNRSFPSARLAKGAFNLSDRIDHFLARGLLSGRKDNYQQKELFVLWGGFNDAQQFITANRWQPGLVSTVDFSADVAHYVSRIQKLTALDGDIIVMNIPDMLIFPGGRLSSRLDPWAVILRFVSQWGHFNFNMLTSQSYLEGLHRGTGIKGLDQVIRADLLDFTSHFNWLSPQWIDAYANSYYQMQLRTVNALNQQLDAALAATHDHHIIYANVRALLREFVEDPAYLGFDNVVSPECGPFSAANACRTNPRDKQGYNYLFADDFNLSYKAQKEIFSYLSMLIATPFVLGGIYNSFLSSNIELNADEIKNGVSVKLGHYAAKPVLNIVYNRNWKNQPFWGLEYGYNLGFRAMNYRVPFTDLWAASSYFEPYIYYYLNSCLSLGLESQITESYYQVRREVTFEGRLPLSMKDRYERADLSSQKVVVAGAMKLNWENENIVFRLRGLFGPGYMINHRYEDYDNRSTSVSFMPNNWFYIHGEGKFNLESKKYPTDRLTIGMQAQAQYNQSLSKLKLIGNTKYAPVQFKRKIKLIANYEGDWAIYMKYKKNKHSIIKFGYEGRNYNYLIRQGIFVDVHYQL